MRSILVRRRWTLPTAIALAILVAAPGSLFAQGGFLKKAKDKLAGKPAEEVGPPPEFTDTVLELTGERIDKVLRGLAAGKKIKGPDGAEVAELNRRADEAYDKRNKLMDGKDDELAAHENAVSKYDDCVREEMSALRKRRDKEMEARMMAMNPADIQVIQEMSAVIGQKLAAGDTAGATRAQEEMMIRLGGDASGDSAKARAGCGKPPGKPGWLVQADEQQRIANDSLEQIRQMETRAVKEQAAAAGLTQVQFGIARERMAAFANANCSPSRTWRFSKEEREVLCARKDEIKKAL